MTPEGIKAYCAFAQAAAKRYKGKIDFWQIWNEPNGGFWKGTPLQYAALLAAAGQAIHAANPDAKVLGLNMAFCDVRWAETILKAVSYDPVRTKNLSVPLGESPIYLVGPKGLKAELRKDPGW